MFTIYYSDTNELVGKVDTITEAASEAYVVSRAHEDEVDIEVINERSGDRYEYLPGRGLLLCVY